MHVMKWGILVCTILMAAHAEAGSEIGDYSGFPADLTAAAVAYDVAQFKSSRPELERLLADDYVLAGSDGRSHRKDEALSSAAASGADKTVVISQQIKRVWPNGAVLAGVVEASETIAGKRNTFRGRFADIWAKRKGRWQVVFTQIEKIP